jgi:hypothetical protein
MAKRRKTNRSEIVRQYLSEHPDEGPSQVAQALKRYKVTPHLVSNVKNKMKKDSSPRRKKVRKRSATSVATAGADEFASVVAAAQLIKTCCGLEQAQQALKAAGKVAELVKSEQ